MLILPNWRYEKPSLKDVVKLTIFTAVLFAIGLFSFRSLQRKNNTNAVNANSEKPVKIYKTTPATKPVTRPTTQSAQAESENITITQLDQNGVVDDLVSDEELNHTSNTGITYVPIADAVFDELAEADAKSAQLVDLYDQRVERYLNDREQWNMKFRQAHNDRLSAGRRLINLIPDGDAEDIFKYFNNLSDEQRKELQQKLTDRISDRDASIERLNSLKKEEPIFPSYAELEKQQSTNTE
ncbi:hypothetical protein J5I95_13540 [Candidatus Poribacteria bacterium]|nr:hypothetical protein [Candidatus Poribacteria bacterium]